MNMPTYSTVRIPELGAVAPEFDVDTTLGRRTLADYRGRWLVLFSHCADFTPVCTTELSAYARLHPELAAVNADILSVSPESNLVHRAWTQKIKEKFGVEIPFPIAEDLSMSLALAYGMVHAHVSTLTVARATCVVDPNGVFRAASFYPPAVGRPVRETLRLVLGLQTADRDGVNLPEDWQPGVPGIQGTTSLMYR